MPQKDTSACHNAPVSVRGGDEGTSYYVCGVCHKPCDIAPKSDMPDDGVREQIDEIFEACRSFETGVANSYEFDESQAKHRIEALIAAAETKARIEELKRLPWNHQNHAFSWNDVQYRIDELRAAIKEVRGGK